MNCKKSKLILICTALLFLISANKTLANCSTITPILQLNLAGEESLSITWNTIPGANYIFEYSTDMSFSNSFNTNIPLVIITGLNPCTVYNTRVQAICANSSTTSNIYSFSTAVTNDVSSNCACGEILGCTDPNFCEYSSIATCDDGSCLTPSIQLSAEFENVTCLGNNDMWNIDLTVSGGVAPITFFWANNAVTEDITNVSSGSYFVIASDANNCNVFEIYSTPATVFGCTDANYCEFNPNATCNDGSCATLCCNPNNIIHNEPFVVASNLYKTGELIKSRLQVEANEDLRYEAGERIILRQGNTANGIPGFKVRNGGLLKAKIQPCIQ